MIELDVVTLSMGVLVGEFIIILILMGHLGRESAAHERKAKAEEREAIVKVIQSTRRGLRGDAVNELRDALIDKVRSRQ
jgi:hypothetical protein